MRLTNKAKTRGELAEHQAAHAAAVEQLQAAMRLALYTQLSSTGQTLARSASGRTASEKGRLTYPDNWGCVPAL